MVYWWIWLILAVILLIAEILTPSQMDFLYFGIGCVFAAIADILGFGIILQLLIFALSIMMLLFTFHKVAKKWLYRGGETNIHALIGKEGIVVEKIDNLQFKGRVKIGGEYWKAKSENGEIIEKNEPVVVVNVEGNKVVVRKEVVR